jgi:hypothetical protein
MPTITSGTIHQVLRFVVTTGGDAAAAALGISRAGMVTWRVGRDWAVAGGGAGAAAALSTGGAAAGGGTTGTAGSAEAAVDGVAATAVPHLGQNCASGTSAAPHFVH